MLEDVTSLGRHRALTGALGNLMLLRSYLKPSNPIWVLDPAFAAELYICFDPFNCFALLPVSQG